MADKKLTDAEIQACTDRLVDNLHLGGDGLWDRIAELDRREVEARKARARAEIMQSLQEWWEKRLWELTEPLPRDPVGPNEAVDAINRARFPADLEAMAKDTLTLDHVRKLREHMREQCRPVVVGVDFASDDPDEVVYLQRPMEPDEPRMRVKNIPPETGGPSEAEVEETIRRETEPIRIMMIDLFDGRVIYVCGDGLSPPYDVQSRAHLVAKRALSVYSDAELQDVQHRHPARFTADVWDRTIFESLPDEYGFGRIIDGVFPGDALRIPGVCPRTDNHHRPADHGRHCRACGRGRTE